MKINELRIGNLIEYFQPQDEEWGVEKVGIYDNTLSDIDQSELWRPIPLTEEWLLKFGFENKNKKKNWIYSAYGLKINNGKIISGLGGKMVCVEYVHQLQNLYFALTNEELIIK